MAYKGNPRLRLEYNVDNGICNTYESSDNVINLSLYFIRIDFLVLFACSLYVAQ